LTTLPLPPIWLAHGMKRSGNHAVINWLLPQLQSGFVNNAIPLAPILRGKPFPPRVPFDTWCKRQSATDIEGRNGVLVTLEDHALNTLPFHAAGRPLRRILIVRSPRQLFSSRLRKAHRVNMPAYPRTHDATMRRAVSTWKEHARCYLGEETGAFPGRVAILFDAWFLDGDYRIAISAALGLAFDDSGFGRMSREGGGSSFDSTSFDGRTQGMNVLDRESQLSPEEKAVAEEIFGDPEMRRLEDRIRETDPTALLRR
jgi:hypothetical protein